MSKGKSIGSRVTLPDGRKGRVIDYRDGTVTGRGYEPLPSSPTVVLPDGASPLEQPVTVPNSELRK